MVRKSLIGEDDVTDQLIVNGVNENISTGVHIDLETSELIDTTLKQFFCFSSFLPLQKETIVCTMQGKNVMTIVGTGGGKSLTYLLPAVLSFKPTVVISPIKSLIDDIINRCFDLNIYACKFSGDISKQVHEEQLQKFQSYRVVVVTPEVLRDGELRKVVEANVAEGKIDRIVFDEAHTIVSWGDTFRPDYKEVCEHFARLTGCPKLLLSATVPGKVEAAIQNIFPNLTVLRASVFRENLELCVKERTSTFYNELVSFISEHIDECGIVYCVLQRDVSNVHAELLKRGINCIKYHGQLSEHVKSVNYSKWMSGECKIIVANSSFGMGIDKHDVRYVVHAKMPTSIEEYYQQCGRAGRDGLSAKCILYYTYADKNMLLKLFKHQDDLTPQIAAVDELVNLLEDPVQCSHKCIMMYFGEPRENFSCGHCDNCSHHGKYYLTDGTTDAMKVVQSMVELTGRTVVCKTLKFFLAGSKRKQLQEDAVDLLSSFGILEKSLYLLLC